MKNILADIQSKIFDMMQTKESKPVAYSVLDLATVIEGKTPADTFKTSLELARAAEKLGYTRYWLAEHHNMISVASSATSVLIGYIAGGTSSIRVGSGGIMLPNHAPLIVAEQFGTLASLYPGRIDLGLGRAPGTDQVTARAIRGENFNAVHNFPNDIQALQTFFSKDNHTSKVRANPGEGLDIPIWVLGSSTDSARVAAAMGLPYAFASHFAPAYFLEAIALYRKNFRPSVYLDKPYVMACVNVVAADTDVEADWLSTSILQFFLGVVSGKRKLLQPPVEDMNDIWGIQEEHAVSQMLAYSFIGGPEKLKQRIKKFFEQTQVDEIMATSHIFDHQARIKSYQLFSQVVNEINTLAV
ncbi:LLM class flavin-dependent oxidoreductase [Dyadobacter sp. LHD-138]|uniref:LLM class flavin-dependent oxidoreductase n=1 Tax=Dyadobacter sp. LHD-138 TaxID=3071413 RepID=UPI0027DF2033|nr:LLM class flavin-dependent oxidoreductase [Dyadobacter sp. LHD-138]MDQ6481319.1 LLM class flavin-dependent oxidoreductase [Dyadobacter sp. LHD-138]